jgi:aromatic ring-opening dioxygenase LigB subunit
MGGSRAEQCSVTTEAMFKAANELLDTKPDRVIVLNPHLIHYPNAYTCVSMQSSIYGNFKAFGRPDLQVEFPSEPDFYEYLTQSTIDNEFPIEILNAKELDHGALVPLWFLQSVGFKSPVCILGYPWRISRKSHTKFGRILRQVCSNYEGSTAIIASGDMSHRLQYGAPSGYHPKAHIFDDTFRAHVEAGELLKASQIPVDLRDLAAEDSSESMAIAAGVIGDSATNVKLFSYEAPFGVGYLVAVLA